MFTSGGVLGDLVRRYHPGKEDSSTSLNFFLAEIVFNGNREAGRDGDWARELIELQREFLAVNSRCWYFRNHFRGRHSEVEMSQINPTVRYLILCEDVATGSDQPRRVTLVGLISAIHSLDHPAYPLLYREICVFLQLTECRGTAKGRIEIHRADTGEVTFGTKTRDIPFSSDPLEVVGVTFRIRNCLFAIPGLYWFQFWYNERMIAQQPLLLR